MTETIAAPTDPRPVLGAPLPRRDGVAKTGGTARYSADQPVAQLAQAALVHAPLARGRIREIRTARAEAYPGVVAVLTHLNAPALTPTPAPSLLNLAAMAAGTRVNYLNTDEVHFDGQPVAVVVAESIEAAQAAAELVEAEYEPLPAAVDLVTEAWNAGPQPGTGPIGTPGSGRRGDADAALARSEFVVDNTFTTPPHHHNALEPHATTAVWEGDRLTVYDGTQNIDWVASHLATKFGIPAPDVRVVSTFVGGAFGGKTAVWPATVLAVLAARVTGRPVKLALSREGVYRTVGGRTPTQQRLALGADREGNITALVHTSVIATGRVGGYPEQVTSCSRDLYDAAAIRVEQKIVELDVVPNAVMRAPGEAVGSFALETSIDELAHAVGVDPIALRLRNQPARTPIEGKRYSRHGVAEALRIGAERFGWVERTAAPGSMRDGHELVGWGVAAAFHPAWQFPANVELSVADTGTVTVRCAFHEMGMGSATAVAQITAHLLGVDPEQVLVEYGDSVLPTGPGAGGSGQTASIAASLEIAARKVLDRVHRITKHRSDSPLAGIPRRDLVARAGGVHARGKGEDWATLLKRAGERALTVRVGADRGLGALAGQVRFMTKLVRDGRKWSKAASGAQFCEVRIDPDTGETRISRWLGVFDIGTVVNARTAASQVRGGIVMGIGLALTEATLVDPRNGRIMNPSLTEYHVPVHADIPPIDVDFLGEPDPTMPLGILGAGEVGITGAGAAVANAIFHATGRRLRDLPLTLDHVVP